MRNNRIAYLDSLKGFAIILVILGHIIQMWYDSDFTHNKVWLYIYSFHMPLFMFISGYITGIYSNKLSISQFSTKRFIQLIVPLFFWTSIYLFENKSYEISGAIRTSLLKLWFLWALFIIAIIYMLCDKIISRFNLKKYIVFLVAILAVFILAKLRMASMNQSISANIYISKYLYT